MQKCCLAAVAVDHVTAADDADGRWLLQARASGASARSAAVHQRN